MENTVFLLPQAVVGNGVSTGADFDNPNNILFVDGELATSQPGDNQASDILIGNYNVNLPQNAVVTGIEIKLIAKKGSVSVPPISVTPILVNELVNTNTYVYYPGDAYLGLTTDLEAHILGGQYDKFGKDEWTPDEINNVKLDLVANGYIEVDSAPIRVYYYLIPSPLPPTPTDGFCADCNSTIQAQPFELARTMESGDTFFILKSFNLPTGEPITLDMLGECGGEITLVFDKNKPKVPGQNFEENLVITSDDAVLTTLDNGWVRIDIGPITNRGLGFKTPYTYDVNNLSQHTVGSTVIITNSARYQNRFLQKCHVGVLVSDIISVYDEGVLQASPVTEFNFIGDIQAEQDPGIPERANISVAGSITTYQPQIENSNEGTTGNTQQLTLTVPITVTAANYLRAVIDSENKSITSVEHDGVPMTFICEEIDPANNIKVSIYGLVNPNPGTNDVVITMGTSSVISMGVTGWLDVDDSNPVDGISSGSSGVDDAPTDTATTSVQNTVMQDVVGTTLSPTLFTQSGLWTIQNEVNASTRTLASSTRSVLVPQAVTSIYSINTATPWVMVMAGIRGKAYPSVAGVQTVTSSSTIIPVNNTDPANPVIGFNLANLITALLASSTFINGISSALLALPAFISGLISNLTTNNSFINALTSNTLFQTNVNNFVSGGGGVANGFSLPSYLYEVATGPSVGNAAFPSQQIIKFGDYIFFGETDSNPASFTFPRRYRVYKTDSVTGQPYTVASPFVQNPYSNNYSMALYSNYDETLLYHVYYNSGLSGLGPVFNITMNIDVYDPTMTLVDSYTGTVGTNSSTSWLRSMFVIGNTAYISTGSTLDTYTLSAGSITTGATVGATNFKQATYDGSNLWTISSSGTTFGKYTISGTTLTPVAATFKYPTASGSLNLYTGCDIGYGIYIGNGKFGIWSPDTIGIAGSTGGGPSYVVAQENAMCTLREYPLP